MATLFGAYAGAAEQPLWEFGLGAGGVVFNDYRGASTTHAYPAPIPYFIYRGRFLQADRDGLHGRFLNQRLVELDVSLNATAPVYSRGDAVRAGMPNLRPTLEVGPSLTWHLWRSPAERLRLDLHTPVREAITVDAPPRAIGVIAAPALALDLRPSGTAPGWNFGILTGPLYAQRAYHEYFYAVAPQFATPGRPAYDPAGGYSGTQLVGSASKRFRSFWFGAYLRHDWLQGAAFADSPLVQQHAYWSGGVGIAWMISASSRMVDSHE